MLHQCQRLPFRLEAGDHGFGVHAQFDDFERDAPAHRFLLLGHVNDTAAAFADFLKQFVMADNRARLLGDVLFSRPGIFCACDGRLAIGKKLFGLFVDGNQLFNSGSKG